MKERFLFIKRDSWMLGKRMFARSVFLMLLGLVGFWLADTMMESARLGTLTIMRRFPDIVTMMTAAAKFTFIEMSIFWIRFGTSPKQDVQEVAGVAAQTSMGAAIVHVCSTLVWFARVVIFLYLMQG